MSYGTQTGTGYNQPASPSQMMAARDLGRSAVSGVVPLVQEVTHAITGLATAPILNVTTAGTRVQLPSNLCLRVTIQARRDNQSEIVVGDSAVVAALATRQGVGLLPGDVMEEEVSNTNQFYIDALVNGDGITYKFYT